MEFISPCLKKLKLHKYVGYRRHYYLAAYYPHAIKRILFMVFGMTLIGAIATTGVAKMINEPDAFTLANVLLVLFLYLIVLGGIPSIIFATQGYRHREKIIASGTGYPSDLPRSSGNETSYILFLSGITLAFNIWFEWW